MNAVYAKTSRELSEAIEAEEQVIAVSDELADLIIETGSFKGLTLRWYVMIGIGYIMMGLGILAAPFTKGISLAAAVAVAAFITVLLIFVKKVSVSALFKANYIGITSLMSIYLLYDFELYDNSYGRKIILTGKSK